MAYFGFVLKLGTTLLQKGKKEKENIIKEPHQWGWK